MRSGLYVPGPEWPPLRVRKPRLPDALGAQVWPESRSSASKLFLLRAGGTVESVERPDRAWASTGQHGTDIRIANAPIAMKGMHLWKGME